MTNREKQHQRKVDKLLQAESRWLQKAMFDLNKVRETREKLALMRDEAPKPIPWPSAEEPQSIDAVRGAIAKRVEVLMDKLQQRHSAVLR